MVYGREPGDPQPDSGLPRDHPAVDVGEVAPAAQPAGGTSNRADRSGRSRSSSMWPGSWRSRQSLACAESASGAATAGPCAQRARRSPAAEPGGRLLHQSIRCVLLGRTDPAGPLPGPNDDGGVGTGRRGDRWLPVNMVAAYAAVEDMWVGAAGLGASAADVMFCAVGSVSGVDPDVHIAVPPAAGQCLPCTPRCVIAKLWSYLRPYFRTRSTPRWNRPTAPATVSALTCHPAPAASRTSGSGPLCARL